MIRTRIVRIRSRVVSSLIAHCECGRHGTNPLNGMNRKAVSFSDFVRFPRPQAPQLTSESGTTADQPLSETRPIELFTWVSSQNSSIFAHLLD